MLHMYINTYSECKMKEYYQEVYTSDLDMVVMPDVTHVVVENEQHEKLFIFIVLGKAKIHENIPSVDGSQITIDGKTWVAVLPITSDAGIYIEIPANIFMMLNIIKRYEEEGVEEIRKEMTRYCRKNHVHDYARDYIVN